VSLRLYDPVFFTVARNGLVSVRSGTPVNLSGDVTGSSGSNTVVKLQGNAVASTAPTNNQVLDWSTALMQWVPTTFVFSGTVPDTRTFQGTAPVTIDGDNAAHDLTADRVWALAINATLTVSGTQLGVVYGTGANTACQGNDARLSDSRTPTGAADSDLGGTYPNPSVLKIRSNPLTAGSPTDNQVYKYNSVSVAYVLADILLIGSPTSATTYNGGIINTATDVVTSAVTPDANTSVYTLSVAATTVTLDNAVPVGTTYTFIDNVGGTSHTFAPNGGGTVNGASTLPFLSANGKSRCAFKYANLTWLVA